MWRHFLERVRDLIDNDWQCESQDSTLNFVRKKSKDGLVLIG